MDNAEQRGDDGGERWDGDLWHFSVRVQPDTSDLAALVVVRAGHACVWINPRHVAGLDGWLVYAWGQQRAREQSIAVLYADELPSAHLPPEPQRVRV